MVDNNRILIGSFEILIDAPFAEADRILPKLLADISERFRRLDLGYGVEFEEISVEPHCIRARYWVFAVAIFAADFVKDYSNYREGLTLIVSDVRAANRFFRDEHLKFNRSLYGPVKSGENLTLILQSLGVKETARSRIISEFVRLNPKAFIDGNPSKLRTGVVLVLPPYDYD